MAASAGGANGALTSIGCSNPSRSAGSHSAAVGPSATRYQAGATVSHPSSSPAQAICSNCSFRLAGRLAGGSVIKARFCNRPPYHQAVSATLFAPSGSG